MKYQYIAVRSYDNGSYDAPLNEKFDEGYEFVRASEYVPETNRNGRTRFGFIEYILRKPICEEIVIREGKA